MTQTTITEEQYLEAREIAAAYERERAAIAAAQRALYFVPVKELVESDAFRTVYDALTDMAANQIDDGYFGMPVNAIKSICRNLATQVSIDMDAAPTGEPE